MNSKRATLWALFGVGGLLFSNNAWAQNQQNTGNGSFGATADQTWLNDSRVTNGPGVQGDRLEYQLGIGANVGYDSNLYLRAGTAAEPRTDAFRLSLTPVVGVRTKAPADGSRPSYALTGQASVSVISYLKAFNHPDDPGVAPDSNKVNETNIATAAFLGVTIAPGARWSGEFHGGVIRSIQPSNPTDLSASYNRTVPAAGTSLTWSPGGGLFSWKIVGYDLVYNYFEASAFQRFNNFNHSISTSASWRFLPRTSLFSDSRLSFIRYSAGNTEQSNGDAVTTRVGANGLLTNSIGFLAAAGWATTVFSARSGAPKQDFDSVVAQAEGRFYLNSPPKQDEAIGVYPSVLTVGYARDWAQSYIGNFIGRDRGYASLGYFFNGKVSALFGIGVARLGFPATTFSDGTARNSAFSNILIDSTAFFEYRFTPHFGANVSAIYNRMISDTKLRGDKTDTTVFDDLRWDRLDLSVGVRYLM
jgi:hypothetical protein